MRTFDAVIIVLPLALATVACGDDAGASGAGDDAGSATAGGQSGAGGESAGGGGPDASANAGTGGEAGGDGQGGAGGDGQGGAGGDGQGGEAGGGGAGGGQDVSLVEGRPWVVVSQSPDEGDRRLLALDVSEEPFEEIELWTSTTSLEAEWSPDGRRLAGLTDGQVRIWSFETDVPTPAGTYAAPGAFAVDGWDPSGRYLVIDAYSDSIIVDTTTGEVVITELLPVPGQLSWNEGFVTMYDGGVMDLSTWAIHQLPCTDDDTRLSLLRDGAVCPDDDLFVPLDAAGPGEPVPLGVDVGDVLPIGDTRFASIRRDAVTVVDVAGDVVESPFEHVCEGECWQLARTPNRLVWRDGNDGLALDLNELSAPLAAFPAGTYLWPSAYDDWVHTDFEGELVDLRDLDALVAYPAQGDADFIPGALVVYSRFETLRYIALGDEPVTTAVEVDREPGEIVTALGFFRDAPFTIAGPTYAFDPAWEVHAIVDGEAVPRGMLPADAYGVLPRRPAVSVTD